MALLSAYPKKFQPIVAVDELLDAIDSLSTKLIQCRRAGITTEEMQTVIDDYLLNHSIDLKEIRLNSIKGETV